MSDSHQELTGQPLLPNDRVQGAWFTLLVNIMGSRSKSDARETYQQAQGYMAALQDAELIDDFDAQRMGTTALRALNEALERLHPGAEVNQP
jgi:hypothetical protein